MGVVKIGRARSLRVVACLLSLSILMLPAGPMSSIAQDTVPSPDTEVQTEQGKVVILSDHKKESAEKNQVESVTATEEDAVKKEETTPIVADQKKTEAVVSGEEAEKKPTKSRPLTSTIENMSTAAKVGVGVGAALLVGGVVALSGGGSDSGPRFPSEENLVGSWQAEASSTFSSLTYTGTYTIYPGGGHSYDLVLSDGEHKSGGGSWTQPAETYTLTLRNDTGSVYVGEFLNGDFSTINLGTTNAQWSLTLTKM